MMLVKLGKPESEVHTLAEWRAAAQAAPLALIIAAYDRSTFSTAEGCRVLAFDLLASIEARLPAEEPHVEMLRAAAADAFEQSRAALQRADLAEKQVAFWQEQCHELGERLAKINGCGARDEVPAGL